MKKVNPLPPLRGCKGKKKQTKKTTNDNGYPTRTHSCLNNPGIQHLSIAAQTGAWLHALKRTHAHTNNTKKTAPMISV